MGFPFTRALSVAKPCPRTCVCALPLQEVVLRGLRAAATAAFAGAPGAAATFATQLEALPPAARTPAWALAKDAVSATRASGGEGVATVRAEVGGTCGWVSGADLRELFGAQASVVLLTDA